MRGVGRHEAIRRADMLSDTEDVAGIPGWPCRIFPQFPQGQASSSAIHTIDWEGKNPVCLGVRNCGIKPRHVEGRLCAGDRCPQ